MNALKTDIDAWSMKMKTIRMLVCVNDGNTLSGACSMPGWDGTDYPSTGAKEVFSEQCFWSAHRLGQGGGDWKK
jgi:hypothetical protein